jgi:hypothetical protein
VLGRSEKYSLTTQAITVRYFSASLWGLPVVGHELGHFVERYSSRTAVAK